MKKKYLKSNRLFAFVLSLFIVTSFYSCNKSDDNLYGVWESDYFEVEYKDPHPYYLDEELILRAKMTLVFGNYPYYRATITINNLELFDRKNDITYHNTNLMGCCPFEYQPTYIYDGRKNLTLTFDNYGLFSRQTWTGKVKKDIIDVKIIFGKTVTFRKQ